VYYFTVTTLGLHVWLAKRFWLFTVYIVAKKSKIIYRKLKLSQLIDVFNSFNKSIIIPNFTTHFIR